MKKLLEFFINLFKRNKKATDTSNTLMPNKYLSDSEFRTIAAEFDIPLACVYTIFEVEAGGKSGFLQEDSTLPVTLQEGHIFYKYAKQKKLDVDYLSKAYPTICYPKWTKQHYKTGKKEYERYLLAKTIDEECAMLSTSWGIGQCMGFNYKACGYTSLQEFIKDMHTSEVYQLRAMCNFIKSNPKMYNALKNKDFTTFASLYNGPGQVDLYSGKLQKAYNKHITNS